jgi:hypothetical protein
LFGPNWDENADREDDEYKVLHTIEHYPNVRTIVRSANEGCHLCSIVVGSLRTTLSRFDEVESARHRERPILSTIILLPYYYMAEAAFDLWLHRGRRRDWRDWRDCLNRSSITIKRVHNDHMLGCRTCELCVDTPPTGATSFSGEVLCRTREHIFDGHSLPIQETSFQCMGNQYVPYQF